MKRQFIITKAVYAFSLGLFVFAMLFMTVGCEKIRNGLNPNEQGSNSDSSTQILMLIVDYTTNRFEGGKELTLDGASNTFTITTDYHAPGDFGDIKLYYSEINKMLFYGTIVWRGCGEIEYPENLLPADSFECTLTSDYIFPANGFEIVSQEGLWRDTAQSKYSDAWSAVQSVIKAREYLASNPSQKVKIFFYTPSVGAGNPADWKWILFLKKEDERIVNL
jgi:hypothetical protein